ncbi:YdcF family protein [Lacticaseibacillus zeae]|uniref:YdcF family protein n=1 Tax=Lacticaseibacillus zeae subsp. silagei TaxID=3068307 RepID=A0ABD7Z8L0_LACZE|nr:MULTISPECIES: YdcF family protein [Lacticaseibacillus]MDE3316446.1 YdcF family protein [Lacticaseibacillus zeae]OFR96601.1 hypothetical protein HMPREF2861_08250 [Lactobacillus sp. HMSC068F07]WLV83246.1 YdcF family protein [Lacticaseibacillus sp. NCIMB 15475]WLV85995.1 YdcF family protein [Lacticaseibacillus sp. NCIMB 15474]
MTVQETLFVFSIPIVLGIIFAISFTVEPRRLINGWLFNLFAVAFLFALALAILGSSNLLLISVTGTLFIITVLIVILIFTLHLFWLLWNAILVWRREGHSLSNMLTLYIAIGLLLLEIAASFGRRFIPEPIYITLAVFFSFGGLYVLLTLYNFLTVLVLYNLRPQPHNRTFLIVLGAGLLHGDQVSPLLASRIDTAIKFYHKQIKKGRPAPRIIFSGGKGGDETISEALAMQRYALGKGIPEKDTLLEDKSTTTLENMTFSKRLITQEVGEAPYKASFFTNNYHLFRAGIYARMAGIDANGVGGNTSFYFLPNAVIREYLALVVLYKRRHAIAFGIIVIMALAQLLRAW